MEKLKAHLTPRCADWAVPQVCFKGDPESLPDYKKKYRELDLKTQISQQDQDFIARALDPQSMAYWGYNVKLS